jgi:8-oxo-dGTP pyrophosphatase MutT (NUDIX family)
MLRLGDGSWEVPGGTLEPGESYREAMRRELREEAGAEIKSYKLFGGWRCRSHAEKPYRPHVPFPEYYRVVAVGEVLLRGTPGNPSNGEHVAAVECVPLEKAVRCFRDQGRDGLAELYALADYLMR